MANVRFPYVFRVVKEIALPYFSFCPALQCIDGVHVQSAFTKLACMELSQHMAAETDVVSDFAKAQLIVDGSEFFQELLVIDFKQWGVRLKISLFT